MDTEASLDDAAPGGAAGGSVDVTTVVLGAGAMQVSTSRTSPSRHRPPTSALSTPQAIAKPSVAKTMTAREWFDVMIRPR